MLLLIILSELLMGGFCHTFLGTMSSYFSCKHLSAHVVLYSLMSRNDWLKELYIGI